LGERELLFDRDEGMEKMTIGGEGVWYIYHPHHPQNGRVRQTSEPPRWGAEVSRLSAEVPRCPGQIRIQLSWLFVAGII
jgi:hypothetical protein